MLVGAGVLVGSGELAGAMGLVAQELHHSAPRRIGERREGAIERGGGSRERAHHASSSGWAKIQR